MNQLGIIRKFKTPRFTVIVDAVEDDSSLDDLHSEPDAQDEIRDKLNSGEWVLFCARARVLFDGNEVASDYLGGCVYASFEEFADHRAVGAYNRKLAAKGKAGRCGSYFADMIARVCEDARNTIMDYQSISIRQPKVKP